MSWLITKPMFNSTLIILATFREKYYTANNNISKIFTLANSGFYIYYIMRCLPSRIPKTLKNPSKGGDTEIPVAIIHSFCLRELNLKCLKKKKKELRLSSMQN